MHDQRLALDSESNPQVALASLDRLQGRNQIIPPFIRADGPVRVARFVRKTDGTPDGDVHQIYSIAGRLDADGCNLQPPNFSDEIAKHNVVFRIPTPAFGAGLVEVVSDHALVTNLASTLDARRAFGIGGHFNRSPNDGTITRFGWKAQNKSLLIFAAESLNVEMGVTSEVFPNKRNQAPDCAFNALPEDAIKVQPRTSEAYQPSDLASDVDAFAAFMRLSAPPASATHTPSEMQGQALFSQIGCSLCHSPVLETGKSKYGGMSNAKIQPYSDFALHHMGPYLADHIAQGLAGGDEFRTAPLWGLGQRIFFLHDGRTSDLLVAIQDHASTHIKCRARTNASEACSSEANAIISRFNRLSEFQRQEILNFLRSL